MVKDKLILHICCAPDEAWVVHTLRDRFELFCYFCNPNISPAEEYELRVKEAAEVAAHFGVPFSADEYAPETWEAAVKDTTETPEGGERCRQCYLVRLRRTARLCKEKAWPSFTTVMSISPHKNVRLLNECGELAAQESGVTYMPFDFKKGDGFRKSAILSKDLGLYRQDYCGCRLSRKERDERNRKKLESRIQ
jgi:hypothetical protein